MVQEPFCRHSVRVALISMRQVAVALVALFMSAAGHVVEAQTRTTISIQQDRFFINGAVTHPGTAAEGLLLNSRMVQAIFDDEDPSTLTTFAYPDTGVWDKERNVTEFMAALPLYAAKGLRAVTVNLQGGFAGETGIVSAYTSDGTLKGAWLDRLDRVIRAADQQGMVVIVGLFYFRQDHRLANEAAVIRAVDGVTDWLLAQGYNNVLVEINNEANILYDHEILKPGRVSELITRVRQRSSGRLKVSTSLGGGSMPSATMISASDYVLLHGNNQSSSGVANMVENVRSSAAWQANPKPIVFNEDSDDIPNLDAAVSRRASWGYYDQGENDYATGYQSPPVNWGINTPEKQRFFDRVAVLTGSPVAPPPPPPPPPTGAMQVTHFTLINADTSQPISGFDMLTGGAVTLNLSQLPTRNLSLRAHTSPPVVGSVRFGLNGNATHLIENLAPYALAGDDSGIYIPWGLGPGSHVVTATPYSGGNASGTAGSARTLTLTIVDTAQPPPAPPPPTGAMQVTHFTLINADTSQPISGFDMLTGGAVTLNLSQLPTRNLSLRAHTSPPVVGSVRFGLNGNATHLIENVAPYALAGDDSGIYIPWGLGPGSHVVTATPYSGGNASGTAGSARTLTLTVVDTAQAPRPPTNVRIIR